MDFKKNPSGDFRDIEDTDIDHAREEVEALREGIAYHDYRYYIVKRPRVPDSLYDSLLDRLAELEDAFPELQSDLSPTMRISEKSVLKREKKVHTRPFLSLQSTQREDEVTQFAHSVIREAGDEACFILEPKYVGMTVEVVYERGCFAYGSTRGDDETGEDISGNLRTIRSLPLTLQRKEGIPEILAIRGEIFLPYSGFQEINRDRLSKGAEPFADPRSATIELMRRLNPEKVARWPFDIVFYELLKSEGKDFDSYGQVLEALPGWGLKTPDHILKTTSLTDFEPFYSRLQALRHRLDYEVRGMVIKVDDLKLRERLGTIDGGPCWALAWDFPARENVTAVYDVACRVGKGGVITQVALLEPVEVEGRTVSLACIDGPESAGKKDIRPGDTVVVDAPAGGPPVIRKRQPRPGKKRAKPFTMPSHCPSCGSVLEKEGATFFCLAGLSCTAQLANRINHYGSPQAANIDGLGKKVALELVERGLVKDMSDIYKLTEKDIRSLDGFADKSAHKLYEAIQAARTLRLDRFLYALGIRHVGEYMAQILARHFGTLEDIHFADIADLTVPPEVGPEIAKSVSNFFRKEANSWVLDELLMAGVKVEDMPAGVLKSSSLVGKTFVFTGKLRNYKRGEAERLVVERGGSALDSVNDGTDFVVAGKSPGSKLDEAKEQNIHIIDEEEFERFLDKD